MGTPAFYWHPAGSPGYQFVELPHVSRVEREQFRSVIDTETPQMMTRLDRGGGTDVRIVGSYSVRENAAAVRALMTLDSYLRSGGRVAFTSDDDLAYMSVTTFGARVGETVLYVDANALPFSSSVVLQSGADLLIQTPGPCPQYERVALSQGQTAYGTGHKLNLTAGLLNEFPPGSIVRWFRTFPILYLGESQSNSSDRWLSDVRYPGIVWDMDLTLTEQPGELAGLAQGGIADGESVDATQGGMTLNTATMRQVDRDGRSVTQLDITRAALRNGRW